MTPANAQPSGLAPGSSIALLSKRLNDVICFGTIVEEDHIAGKFRVRIGEPDPLPDEKGGKADTLTYWLPALTGRAGANRSYSMPEIDDQVCILSPNGQIGSGFIAFSLNKEGHAPHAARDKHIERYVWGQDPDLLNTLLDEVSRIDWHRLMYFKDDGYLMATAGKDYLAGAGFVVEKDHIGMRVKDTSICVYADRIELQVSGNKVQIEMTASAIIAQVLGKSLFKMDAASIDSQVEGKGQVKISAADILTRVESAITKLTSNSYLEELVAQKVKTLLNAQGFVAQTEKSSIVVTVSGDITSTSNGSKFALVGPNIVLRSMDYDAAQEAVPPIAYSGATVPAATPQPTIPVYVPKPRPPMEPGVDPFIPPTPMAILS